MNWALHFPYIAAYLGVTVTPADAGRASPTRRPSSSTSAPLRDRSFFTLAVEKAAGRHSGLDSTVKHLLSIGLVEDAPTLEGPVVASACADALEPNDRILYKTALRPGERDRRGEGQLHGQRDLQARGDVPEAIAPVRPQGLRGRRSTWARPEAQHDLFKGRVLDKLRGVLDADPVRAAGPRELRRGGGGARRVTDDGIAGGGGARRSCCGSWW